MRKFKTVNDYISNNKEWKNELKKLGKIILKSELNEGVNWSQPVYTFQNKNIVGTGLNDKYR